MKWPHRPQQAGYVVFTDLDGTLLDHYTYSYEPAREALHLLIEHEIPVILCTSKTREELVHYRAEMGIEDPFIVENGAAIFVPLGYFDQPASTKVEHGYEIVELGEPYEKIRAALKRVASDLGLPVRGFGDVSSEELMEKTGLAPHQAAMALRRSYSEPFWFESDPSESLINEFQRRIETLGLQLVRGGRFFHLLGRHQKGDAVRRLLELYRKDANQQLVSVGIGDSPNDISLLKAVDIPFLVKNGRGQHHPEVVAAVSPRLVDGVGPEGWNQAVRSLFGDS